MAIKVLVVDDHEIMRESVRLLLEQESDITVVGVAGDGRKAIEKVSALAPDVVLMNVGMPGLNGIETTPQIRKGIRTPRCWPFRDTRKSATCPACFRRGPPVTS